MTAPTHETYPLGLRLDGRRVVVVGGGPVAARRTRGLLDAGAVVTVVSPFACEDLAELLTAHGPGTTGHAAAHGPAAGPARDGRLAWVRRDYLTGDLDGAWLVHTATGDARVDAEVAADAEADRVFCVTAGDAERATAWVPAVARTLVPGAPGTAEAEVTVAVNAGRDPRRAVRVRDAVAALLETGELRCDRCVRPLPTPARRLPPRRRGPGPRPSRGAVTAPLVRPVGSVALVGGGPGDAGLISVRDAGCSRRPTSSWSTGSRRARCSPSSATTSWSWTSARRRATTPCRRTRSTGSSCTTPSWAAGSSGSRAATRTSSGAAGRSSTRAARTASRWRSSRA